MKILTIFASIFIPLTFIAGIYGMNFEYMPELKWRWAYPVLWVIFITISLGLLYYFKKKRWIWLFIYKLKWLNLRFFVVLLELPRYKSNPRIV